MSEHVLINLGSIIILGIGAQWLAWRLQLPSILFLLVFGFIAGPVTDFLHPDKLMGEMLMPFVSLAVAVILFEGGMTLALKELRDIGKVIFSLISVGVLVTWIIGTVAAYYLLNLNFKIAILLGAILVVTGPTVIGPLLRHIRPARKVADILKWEGIVIDPIGALLALLVFEAILAGEFQQAGIQVFLSLVKTIFFGGLAGYALARLLLFLLKRYWIPDFLHESVTLSMVIAAYLLSNYFQPESGLLATTLMGLVMANQRHVTVKHILEFKENLRVLIISFLFIVLAARLDLSVFNNISMNSLLLLAVLIFIGRPAAVWLSSIGMGLSWREKTFLSWMAPRGIVAAAVASIFALRLTELQFEQTELLLPLTFIIIVGTVAIYGLTSTPLARWLNIAQSNAQGVLFIGAHAWALEIARAVQSHGFKVTMIDTNQNNINKARKSSIPVCHGSVLSEQVMDEIHLDGIGRLVALTSNDEANSLAILHYNDVFDRGELYQLPPTRKEQGKEELFSPKHLRGRFLFGEGADFNYLTGRFRDRAKVVSEKITADFNFEAFKKKYGDTALPLFLISSENELKVISSDQKIEPKDGQTIIALVDDNSKKQQ